MNNAYLGGKLPGGKSDRESANKVAFRGGRANHLVRLAVVACLSRRPVTKKAILDFASRSLAAPAILVSDGLGCFNAVHGTGILHESHGASASVLNTKFLAINTLLGNLKTAFSSTYHAFGFAKYAHRYLAQVQHLFNRRYDLLSRLACVVCRTSPCPFTRIRAAESTC